MKIISIFLGAIILTVTALSVIHFINNELVNGAIYAFISGYFTICIIEHLKT